MRTAHSAERRAATPAGHALGAHAQEQGSLADWDRRGRVMKLVVTPGRITRQSAASSGLHHMLTRRSRAATGRRQARTATLAPAVASCLGGEREPAGAGWGFTDCGFGERPDAPLGPAQKREHLFAFWQAKARARPGSTVTMHREHAGRERKGMLMAGRAGSRTIGPCHSEHPRACATLPPPFR